MFRKKEFNATDRLPYGCPDDWKELPIKYLVRFRIAAPHYIVFIGPDYYLDWRTDPKSQELSTKEDESSFSFRKILNDAACLEVSVENWDSDLKLSIKRMIGEAIANGLEGDFDGATEALAKVRELIEQKRPEVSKSWIFEYSLRCTVVSFAVCLILSLLFGAFLDEMFPTLWHVPAVIGAGCIGALYSILFNLRKYNFDSMSERQLHAWEAGSRVFIGGVAGLLALLLVNVEIIFSSVDFHNNLSAYLLVAFVAGVSERLVPGIIENMQTNRDCFSSRRT